jgi:DNA-binding beta-propeller fold protein YncE
MNYKLMKTLVLHTAALVFFWVNTTPAPCGTWTTRANETPARDAATPAIVATIPIPDNSTAAVDVNSTTNRIYTSGGASSGQVVSVIDGNTNLVIATVAGSGAHVNTLTNRIYAGQLDFPPNPSYILVYDGITNGIVAQIRVTGCAFGAAVDPTLNRVYGSTQCGGGNDLIFPIDTSTNTPLNSGIGSGGVMGEIVVNPVTHTAYFSTNSISKKLNPATFAVTSAPFQGVVRAVNAVTNRLYSGNGATTQVIDGATESVLATLPAVGPVAVDTVTNQAYVSDAASSSVKIFDGATNGLTGTIPLPAGSSPGAIAFNSATGRLYLIVSTGSGASLLVITTGAATPNAPDVTSFSASPSVVSPGQPSTLSWTTVNATSVSISGVTGTQAANGSVSVSPRTTTTYTLTATGVGGTAIATTTITALVTTIPIPANSLATVDVNSTTNRIYTSGGASAQQVVTVVDGNTNKVIATVPGSGAHANALTNRFYAGQLNPPRILVYDGAANAIVAQITVGGCAIAAAVDSTLKRVYGSAQCGSIPGDLVFPIDSSTNTVLKVVSSGGVMGDIVVNPVTHNVYISPSGVSKKLDPASFAVTNNPFPGVVQAVNAVTNRLYAQNGASTQVIDGATESVLATLPAAGPVAADLVTNQVYVSDAASSSVKIFDGVTHGPAGAILLPAGSSPGAIAANSATGRLYLIVSTASGANLLVIAIGPGAPAVTSFGASPQAFSKGQSTTLNWTTTDATSVSISGVAGTHAANGSVSVTPATTTTYTLTATGPRGKTTATTTVTVTVNTGSPAIMATIPLPANSLAAVDVNAATNRIYTSGGASAQQVVTVIDGNTNKVTGTVPGSGAHVNTLMNRFYAGIVPPRLTDPSNVLVYDGTTNGIVAQIPVIGCAIGAAVDSKSNRVYGSTQCSRGNDLIFPIDGSTNTLLNAGVPSGGVMGDIVVNPVTHSVYMSPSGVSKKLNPASFAVTNTPFLGVVQAVNAVTNRLYARSGTITQVIDGATESVLGTLPAAGPVAVDSATSRVYVSDAASSSVKIFNGATNALTGTLHFPAGSSPGPIGANSATGRVYVIVSAASGASLQVITPGVIIPTVVSFTASPATISAGQSSQLSWTTINATSVSISGFTGKRPPNGSLSVSPAATSPTTTATYTLTATGPGGTVTAKTTVTVKAVLPTVVSFTASPATINAGQSSQLTWTTTNATSVSISGVSGTHPGNGSVSVSPAKTTSYTLTATGAGGTATATTTVTRP